MVYIRRMLGCGVGLKVLEAKFKALPEIEQERLQRVAWRMWITLKIRYQLAIYPNPMEGYEEELAITTAELPSLEVYLLFTCLDTLAGQNLDFKAWLHRQPKVSGLDTSGIVQLYDQYLKEYGVTRNLLRLFENLPQSVKSWLVTNVIIQRQLPDQDPFSALKAKKEPDVLIRRLFDYFYNFRRNPFTHSSVTRFTSVADDIRPANDKRNWVLARPGWGYRDKDNRVWNLFRPGTLDEATILRVIVSAAALQKLEIEVTPGVIEAQLRNYSRLHALYRFLGEVQHNVDILSWWPHFDTQGKETLHSYLAHVGIPNLDSQWSSILLGRLITQYPRERGIYQVVVQYLDAVNRLTSAISSFNESNPPSSGASWDERVCAIKEFVEAQVQAPHYNVVIGMVSQAVISDIRLVIRDPCYS